MVVKIVLTGFSSFPGVAANPTETLVKEIKRLAKESALDLPGCAVLHHACILKVAAVEVRRWLDHVTETVCQDLRPDDKVLLIHVGVDAKSTCLKLETTAYNNATFKVPDVDGWQPTQQKIVDGQGAALDDPLCTNLNLADVQDVLQQQQFQVELSDDPGRYVCNWTYFLSLYDDNIRGAGRLHSLFVHVPPFSCIPQQQQTHFLLSLMKCLCQQLAEQPSGGAAEGVAEGVKANEEICVNA